MSKKVVKKAGKGKGKAPETIYVKSPSANPRWEEWADAVTYLFESDLVDEVSVDCEGDLVGVYQLVAVKKIAISKACLTDA